MEDVEQTQNSKYNPYLKIYGIWFILNFIIYLICYHKQLLETLPQAIGCILIAPFAFALVFSPAILILCLLFKKIINPYWRCTLISLLIPLNNYIYYIIEYNPDISYYTIIIGICSLCWIVPLAFLTFLLTPKSILKWKWYAVLTTFLMFIFGWIMAYYTLILPLSKIKIID